MDMPPPDHDQLFKVLIKAFIRRLFEQFWPDYAALFDFERGEWLEQEVFPDPPKGVRRKLDLVGKFPLLATLETHLGAQTPEMLVVIHIEVESRDSVEPLRQRMLQYFSHLRQKYSEPILPIAIYLRVGLDGVGADSYVERFGAFEVLRYNYFYVGLPAIDGVKTLTTKSAFAAALSALMKIPHDARPEHKAEALRQVAESGENEYRKYLLAECIETYLPLASDEETRFQQLVSTEKYREVKTMTTTLFERARTEGMALGIKQGRQQGIEEGREEGQRKLVVSAIEDRFGALTDELSQRVATWPANRLVEFLKSVYGAKSIDELPKAPPADEP